MEIVRLKKMNNDLVVKDAELDRDFSKYVLVLAETWEEGAVNSKSLGENLLTINNKEKYTWLQNNLWLKNKLPKASGVNGDRSTYYFVGLNDVKKESMFGQGDRRLIGVITRI